MIQDPQTEVRIRNFAADLGVSQQEAVAEAFRRLIPEPEQDEEAIFAAKMADPNLPIEERIRLFEEKMRPLLDALPPESRRPVTKEEREALYE